MKCLAPPPKPKPSLKRLHPPLPPTPGMVALPRAYLALGALWGTLLLLAVAALALFTSAVLVRATARHPAAATYRSLARATCGPRVALLAQLAVILFCGGFLVVDLVRGGICVGRGRRELDGSSDEDG